MRDLKGTPSPDAVHDEDALDKALTADTLWRLMVAVKELERKAKLTQLKRKQRAEAKASAGPQHGTKTKQAKPRAQTRSPGATAALQSQAAVGQAAVGPDQGGDLEDRAAQQSGADLQAQLRFDL